jgi:RNA polymerase III subunit Rpc25
VCRHGITLDLGMFKDVFVPERYMQSPGSMFDASKQLWFWKYEADFSLWLMAADVVRFKVREVIFRDSNELPKQGVACSGNLRCLVPVASGLCH